MKVGVPTEIKQDEYRNADRPSQASRFTMTCLISV